MKLKYSILLCTLWCGIAVQARDAVRSKDSSCHTCNDAFQKCCTDLPQPPKNTPVPLEGENCICCFESRDLPSGSHDLNQNKDCQSYDAMCKLFCKPLDYPGIIFPAELTYTLVPTFTVPPCQKIVNPPPVPVDIQIPLKDKHVLVIGGSKGNGKAIAKRFRQEGARVIATSRHPGCYKKPKSYKLLQLDVRFENEVKSFINRVAREEFDGQIDIVVNCPGIHWYGPLAEATGTDLANSFETMIFGYQRVVHYALPYMRHSNDTRVISLGTNQAYFNVGYASGGYSVAKRALQNWNDTLQVEELLKKAQGLVQFGPTFTLMEPFFMLTTIGLYEYYKASELSIKDPLVLGARIQIGVPQNVTGGAPTSLIAEAVFRVAVAPQPGVRYSVNEPNATIFVPGFGDLPILEAIQLVNSVSPDEAVQLNAAVTAVDFIANATQFQQIITEAYCKSCSEKFRCNKVE